MKDYNDKSGLAYYWLEANMGRVLLVVAFAWLGVWGLLLEGRDDLDLGRRLVRGMGPELAGIVIAAVTIDALAERRLQHERKAQLIRQLGSKYRDVTEMSVIELRHKKWLEDGSLIGANLIDANLSEADLHNTNLRKASLFGANLSRADLSAVDLRIASLFGANLSEANLLGANLSGADLLEANLSGANMVRTNLSKADLSQANLSRAYMLQADLSGACGWTIKQLDGALILVGAVMPNGVQLGWEETVLQKRIEGPTFQEWKVQYLAQHGGDETTPRDTGESTNNAPTER